MKLITLSGIKGLGKFAQVDDEDFERINQFKWYVELRGKVFYARTQIGNSKIYMHRFVCNASINLFIDHKNRNGLDNQKLNLRESNKSQNAANSVKGKFAKSKYKGVFKNKWGWVAQVSKNYKTIHLGSFKTEEAAAIEYNRRVGEFHGEFAILNNVITIKTI